MMAQPNPKLNHLLSVLPPEEWSRIAPELALVDMPLGHVVYESGESPRESRRLQLLREWSHEQDEQVLT
ncbi:hypothetical protein ABXT21_25075, partial [Ralstonia sp. SM1864_UCD524_TZ4]